MTEATRLWLENNKVWAEEMKLVIAGNDKEIDTVSFQIDIMQKRLELLHQQNALLEQALQAQEKLVEEAKL